MGKVLTTHEEGMEKVWRNSEKVSRKYRAGKKKVLRDLENL
ncbi:hypothetical protein BH10BAC4_BH10BAC4_06500 [soil metagenome]